MAATEREAASTIGRVWKRPGDGENLWKQKRDENMPAGAFSQESI